RGDGEPGRPRTPVAGADLGGHAHPLGGPPAVDGGPGGSHLSHPLHPLDPRLTGAGGYRAGALPPTREGQPPPSARGRRRGTPPRTGPAVRGWTSAPSARGCWGPSG